MASLYDMSIPMFIRAIENQLAILKKGEKWCEENNIAKTKMVDGKLAEDMKTLPFQVQTVSNTAKFVAVRVAGVENESWEDNETTLEQLYARLEKTLKFLKAVKPEPFVGKETAEVVLTAGGKDYKFTGLSYLQNFAIPNFFFHHMTVYAVLRNLGVPVGKLDYLGGF